MRAVHSGLGLVGPLTLSDCANQTAQLAGQWGGATNLAQMCASLVNLNATLGSQGPLIKPLPFQLPSGTAQQPSPVPSGPPQTPNPTVSAIGYALMGDSSSVLPIVLIGAGALALVLMLVR